MTQGNADQLWDEVHDARQAFYEEVFGKLPPDILKPEHMTGVWPGGGLYKLKAEQLGSDTWLYTTFGLTNPDMPTRVSPIPGSAADPDQAELTLERKQNVPDYPGRPGYGYEIAVMTQSDEEWPLWLLQWALNAEILNDVDLLGRVENHNGLTVEDIRVGDSDWVNVLIAPASTSVPDTFGLPNGTGRLLIATTITDDEMVWSKAHGRETLLNKLASAGVGQVSHLTRASILNPEPLDYAEIGSREQAEQLANAGQLRKIHLFPLEFGGEDHASNTVYVSKAASLNKKGVDQQILRLAEQGRINSYTATPSYHSNSFIPTAIQIEASGEQAVSTRIDVW